MYYSASANISIAALQHNLMTIRRRQPGMPVMAMVKANAYGHGLVDVAKALLQADSLAVARTAEARALREASIDLPLVLLEGVFDQRGLSEAAALGCELVVHTDEQVTLLANASPDTPFIVWLKVDSGMNRLGFRPERFDELVEQLASMTSVGELRVMTHYASADADDATSLTAQIDTITPLLQRFDGVVSLANSPGLLHKQATAVAAGVDRPVGSVWLRPGISLYGISPFAHETAQSLGLQPAMNFEARLIAVKQLKVGEQVGYGGRFTAPQAMTIGIAAAGYGDGYPRMLPDGTPVMVDGKRCVLAGRVSMDMLSIDLTNAPDAAFGSLVQLWGDQLPAETVAAELGTIAYELVTRVSERVHRIYR